MKSPYLVTRHEMYVDTDSRLCQMSDEAVIQRKVVLRAARIPAKSGWWDYALTVLFWGFVGGVIYWLDLLGFWDWMWRLAQ